MFDWLDFGGAADVVDAAAPVSNDILDSLVQEAPAAMDSNYDLTDALSQVWDGYAGNTGPAPTLNYVLNGDTLSPVSNNFNLLDTLKGITSIGKDIGSTILGFQNAGQQYSLAKGAQDLQSTLANNAIKRAQAQDTTATAIQNAQAQAQLANAQKQLALANQDPNQKLILWLTIAGVAFAFIQTMAKK